MPESLHVMTDWVSAMGTTCSGVRGSSARRCVLSPCLVGHSCVRHMVKLFLCVELQVSHKSSSCSGVRAEQKQQPLQALKVTRVK